MYQQYFLVSAGAQLILAELAERGFAPEALADHVVVQINDTHPSMVIPELIRLLTQRGLTMDQAVDQVSRTCAYTNHTILAEALEKWPLAYSRRWPPGWSPSSGSWTAGPGRPAPTPARRHPGRPGPWCTWPTWTSTSASR